MAEWKVIIEGDKGALEEALQLAEAQEWEVCTIVNRGTDGSHIAYLRKKHNWGKTIKGEGQVEG